MSDEKNKIVVFAALPGELKPVVKKLGALQLDRKEWPFQCFMANRRDTSILLVKTGMGYDRAERSVKIVMESYKPHCIISIGFGGAMFKQACVGDVVFASKAAILPQWEELEFPRKIQDFVNNLDNHKVSIYKGTFVTIKEWMEKEEVLDLLPYDLECPVCDMETFPIAKAAEKGRVDFYALRSITDTLSHIIPFAPYEISNSNKDVSPVKFFLLLLKKPHILPKILRLAINSHIAARSLRQTFFRLLDNIESRQ